MNLSPTQYADINTVIADLTNRILHTLSNQVIGVYLFGSLTYGDFSRDTSDIDLMIVVREPLTPTQIDRLYADHQAIESHYSEWHQRIEASYTPIAMLPNRLPPREPRPYYGGGKLWHEALYGNEWIINLYLLKHYGITLYGRSVQTLLGDIDIAEVQQACVRDLWQEWEPKRREREWLDDGHQQAYFVLNLCRILYTVKNADARSKKVASTWVKQHYSAWRPLIETAEQWRYGITLTQQSAALEFLDFVIEALRDHQL